MNLIADLKPILLVARTFGFAPYSITATNLVFSKVGCFYSALCVFVYLSSFSHVVSRAVRTKEHDKDLFLETSRNAVIMVSIVANISFSAIWHKKFLVMISRLQKYDSFTRTGGSAGFPTTRNFAIIIISLQIYIAIHGYCLSGDFLLQVCMDVIIYSSTFCVLMFGAILESLRNRFNQLNQLVVREAWAPSIAIIGQVHQRFQLQDVMWFHECLIDVVKEVNSYYGPQILLWLYSASHRIIILVHRVLAHHTDLDYARIIFLVAATSLDLLEILLIVVVCQMTSTEANEFSRVISSKRARMLGRRENRFESLQDKLYAVMYLPQHRPYFSAAGFMRVDLPLFLSILATMTTYLFIILNAQ